LSKKWFDKKFKSTKDPNKDIKKENFREKVMLDFKRLILAMLHGHLPPHLAFVQDLPRYESFLSLVKREQSTLKTISASYPKKLGGKDKEETCTEAWLTKFFTDDPVR